MEYYPFPAILSTDYNDIHEPGLAQISPQTNALNFHSDFVPLVPLGHKATIRWVLGDTILTTFEGETYLSTAQFLQLTNVDTEKLNTARTLFQINTHLSAVFTESLKKKAPQYEVEVLYLSMGMIKLLSKRDVSEGSVLYLYTQVDFLSLYALHLTVHKKLDFHDGEKLLLCEVDNMTQENYIALSAYTAKLEKQWEDEQEESTLT